MKTNGAVPKLLSAISFTLILLLASPILAQDWFRYIPKKERGDVIKKSLRVSGMGALMSTSSMAVVYWVTDPVARVMVSEMIDRERLTVDEAESRYKTLRPEGSYYFMLQIRNLGGGTFKEALTGPSRRASKVLDPLAKGESFLQRADNRNAFSKAEIADQQFDFIWRSGQFDNSYGLVFPRSTREGAPIVRALADKIEIQFTMTDKKVVFEYKVKDLVTSLADL